MSVSEIKLANEAKGLREQLGYNQLTPIDDLEQLIKDSGHFVLKESFGNEFSAACIHQSGEQFLIVLNADQMWNDRYKRFTLAHELGHISLIEHLAEMQRNGGKLETRAEFRSDKLIEREADLFAVNFLAPVQLFNKLSDGAEFDKASLYRIAESLNLSIMSTAFRFVRLSSLVCSLIISNNSSSRIRFEFRSNNFKELGFLPFLSSGAIPKDTLTHDVINHQNTSHKDEVILLNHWYPDLKKKVNCNESVFQLGYNDTTITMLSVTDDLDDDED